MNWTKIGVNLALTFAAGFGAVWQVTGDWKQSLTAGIVAALANQTGLHQTPPSQSKP